MPEFNKNRVLRGTDSTVFINGEPMGFIKSFEAKLSYSKEEIYANGDYVAKHVITGGSIAGTYTGFKADSRFLDIYADAVKTGVFPEMQVVGKNSSPGAGANERIALYGVLPDEIMLIDFETNALIEEEIPFTADDYKVIEKM